MTTIELLLPSYLLPALVNGDTSGMSYPAAEDFEAWLAERVRRHGDFYAIDWHDEGFVNHGNHYNRLAGDCHSVTFLAGRV